MNFFEYVKRKRESSTKHIVYKTTLKSFKLVQKVYIIIFHFHPKPAKGNAYVNLGSQIACKCNLNKRRPHPVARKEFEEAKHPCQHPHQNQHLHSSCRQHSANFFIIYYLILGRFEPGTLGVFRTSLPTKPDLPTEKRIIVTCKVQRVTSNPISSRIASNATSL